jgi:hypothetical protein
MIRAVLRALLFVALGPLFGLFGANLAIGASTLLTTGSFRDFTFGPELFSPAILTVAYTIGLLPALLTAVVGIVLAPRLMSGWRLWLWLGLSGAIISVILGWIVFGPVGEGSIMPGVFTVVIGAAGAFAGTVCAALYDGLAALLRRR